jgi:sugar phosphate isomerase/epimerase
MSVQESGLSLHPATIGWRVAWPDLAKLAAEAGYEGAVIPGQQPLPVDLTDVRVRATSMQLPTEVRRDEATFESTFPRLRAACEFAAQVGCKTALLAIPPSSELPRHEQAGIYRDRLKKCCALLDEYSIRLALEAITPLNTRRAHPYEFIWRNAEMLDFGLSISPHAGLIMDSWHWHHAGSDPEWIRGIPANHILDVHLSDSPSDAPEDIRDDARLAPGEGVINFKLFFQLLREKEYTGAVEVEVFGGLKDKTPSEAARLAFQATRSTLEACGATFAAL